MAVAREKTNGRGSVLQRLWSETVAQYGRSKVFTMEDYRDGTWEEHVNCISLIVMSSQNSHVERITSLLSLVSPSDLRRAYTRGTRFCTSVSRTPNAAS